MYDCTIIGGGIVGLATGLMLTKKQPGLRLLLLEKETDIACHQTGRNSGVIHSGIYYKPGSLKAMMAREGNQSMYEFCEEHGLAHERCGKIIVASDPNELPRLEQLHERGIANGLSVQRLSPEEVREIEPEVASVGGLRVPSTGIVNYREVCATYARLLKEREVVLRTGTRVERCRERDGHHEITTSADVFESRFIVNCAGLHSDRVAKVCGTDPTARIVPFRGEYYELVRERRYLVKGLIYPVPDPGFPFLGVHFTRMIDGSVHAGPNAVLALKREGYSKTDLNLRDMFETLSYAGFWRFAGPNLAEGLKEIWRSLSKAAFVASLQRLIPAVESKDLVPCHAGVRAQALLPSGKLVDDFLIVRGRGTVHVCNAPSPAATASLEIGRKISEDIPDLRTRTTISTGGVTQTVS